MAFVSVTRLRVRSVRFLPMVFLDFIRTRRQVERAAGFRTGALLADRGWAFWTLTVWDDQASMRRYMTNGSHRVAMPTLLERCDEAAVAHWEQDAAVLPSWAEADRRMRTEGRASKVRHPSSDHAAMRFAVPDPARSTVLTPVAATA